MAQGSPYSMPFEQVVLKLPDGTERGPVAFAQVVAWARQLPPPAGAILIDAATGEERRASDFRELYPAMTGAQGQPGSANPYQSPDSRGTSTSALDALIPSRNSKALAAYYLGVFSLSACIPILGIVGVVMGFTALVLGIKGLKAVNADPSIRGRVHAWIGIICGALFGVLGVLMQIVGVIGMIMNLSQR